MRLAKDQHKYKCKGYITHSSFLERAWMFSVHLACWRHASKHPSVCSYPAEHKTKPIFECIIKLNTAYIIQALSYCKKAAMII